mmetsp:Transcript_4418/g.6271  ORF Transcript_4418/g.6271 Transcript_4418/m.6271 type:complete len:201 (+) Transcript_4418:66-668(+)
MEVDGNPSPASIGKPLLGQHKEPQSMIWRGYHGSIFLLAALQFFVASIFLYPVFWDGPILNASGWMYTIGSGMFVVADFTELWYFKQGDESGGDTYNFSANCLGSLLYVIGSVYAIPAYSWEVGENIYFISGSAIIIIAQAAKIIRPILQFGNFRNYIQEFGIPAFIVDLTTGMGAFGYLVGSSCDLVYSSGSDVPFFFA